MGKFDLPPAVSRYCMVCGSELRVLDLEVRNAEGHGVARCPVCGFETGFAWGTAEEEGALTTTWHTDEQRRTRVVESGVTLDPEPGEPIVEVRDPIERMVRRISDEENQRGVLALIEKAPFRIFGVSSSTPGLRPHGYSWNAGRIAEGDSRLGLGVNLIFAGPGFEDPAQMVIVQSTNRGLNDMDEVKLALQPGEGSLEAVDLLAQAILELPAFRSLGDSGEIYKYLNAKTFRAAGLTNVKTCLPPGDDVVWGLRELSYPVATACGSAKIGRSLVRVAAAGPVAAEFQSLLNKLVWLAPGDPETRDLAAGQRGYMEFLVSRSERGSQ